MTRSSQISISVSGTEKQAGRVIIIICTFLWRSVGSLGNIVVIVSCVWLATVGDLLLLRDYLINNLTI